ncbi:MAG: hypothetical protein NXI10_10890 [bacterium]|nr:hypothetical protein [bacterium]
MRFIVYLLIFSPWCSWSQDAPVLKYISTTVETAEYFGGSTPTLTNPRSTIEEFNKDGQVIRRDFSHWPGTYTELIYDSLGRIKYEIEVERYGAERDTLICTHNKDSTFWENEFGRLCYQITDDQDRITVLYDPSTFGEKVHFFYENGFQIMVEKDSNEDREIKSFYNEHGHLVKKSKEVFSGKFDSEGYPIYEDGFEEWQYEYTFNEHGDWTEALKFQDKLLLSREKRILRYW